MSRTSDYSELRRIAASHPGTPLAMQAEARIASLLATARLNAESGGAPAEQLALCDALRSAANGSGGLSLTLNLPSDEADTRMFASSRTTAMERGYSTGLGYGAHSGFTDGLRTALDATLQAALLVRTGTYAPPSPSVVVNATFAAIEPLLTYTRTRVRDRQQVDSYSYPNVGITIEATLRAAPDAAPIVLRESYTGNANIMAPEHMAEAFPTGERLYRALSEQMGRQAAAAITQRLCLR